MSALAALLIPSLATRGDAAVFATYDAAQHNTNGFPFGDFDDFFAVDTSGGVISIDINQDLDLANGLFGGWVQTSWQISTLPLRNWKFRSPSTP